MIILTLHEWEECFMKNSINYTLAMESRPNSYEPIFIFPKINNIDDLTGFYSKEDFSRMLFKNSYIDEDDIDNPLVIIYNDNGIRKVKEGVIFKNQYSDNIKLYINEFLIKYKDNGNIINQLYQYVVDRKDISNFTKHLLHNFIISRKNDELYAKYILELEDIPYYDLRTVYLSILNTLLPKLENDIDNKLIRRIEN